MKIYLLSIDSSMTNAWKQYFQNEKDIEIVTDDFIHFMDTTKVECVVSPANSYGLMDGGYDAAISDWFGWDMMKKVQSYIIENYRGEQPLGTSFIIDTGKDNIKLIHTPSMRVPSIIRDSMIVYHCMRTCLMTAMENDINSIVITAFGGGTGRLPSSITAKMMWKAYEQVMNPPSELNWEYATRWLPERE